jgi:DnaJ-class molecular chaperone
MFFAEVIGSSSSSAAEILTKGQDTAKANQKDETLLTEKYVNQELENGREQVDRLTASNYKWKNLNPYYVLQLDIDATEEDIRYRYKKLSTKVHPDKLRDIELAREAFEEVTLSLSEDLLWHT